MKKIASKKTSIKQSAAPSAAPTSKTEGCDKPFFSVCGDSALDELGWLRDDLEVVRLALRGVPNFDAEDCDASKIDSLLYRMRERLRIVVRHLSDHQDAADERAVEESGAPPSEALATIHDLKPPRLATQGR